MFVGNDASWGLLGRSDFQFGALGFRLVRDERWAWLTVTNATTDVSKNLMIVSLCFVTHLGIPTSCEGRGQTTDKSFDKSKKVSKTNRYLDSIYIISLISQGAGPCHTFWSSSCIQSTDVVPVLLVEALVKSPHPGHVSDQWGKFQLELHRFKTQCGRWQPIHQGTVI